MARELLSWLMVTCIGVILTGCAADGSAGGSWDLGTLRPDILRERIMGPRDWKWQSSDGRLRVDLPAHEAGPFGERMSIIGDYAHAAVGPLSATTYEGQPASFRRTASSESGEGLDVTLAGPQQRELVVRVRPGTVTVVEVDGADRLAKLTLPVKVDSIERLAMDYGWLMVRPAAFTRSRVMTNFVLAESAGTAVLLGCDASWGFEVDPGGRLAAVALHRAARARFYVGVAPQGQWGALIAAYRRAAHPEWDRPAPNQRNLQALVGRLVLDDWSGLRYDESIELLRRLAFLGCSEMVVVRHNWQHHGYDVKLPDTWPPAERFGGLEAMRALAAYCRWAGLPFGLHENFDDLYADAPTFTQWTVAYRPREWHTGDRQPYKGWFNESTKQQALRHTPASAGAAMNRNLAQQAALRPGTTFLDVTSYTDPDPIETPSGMYMGFEQVLEAERRMYLQAGQAVDGPALGEGCTEKFLGAVDGANCDLWHVDRWGNRALPADWEFFPLMDWLAHDRVVFQGVGYAARYGVPNQVPFAPELFEQPFLDDYNSTNILFGHAPLHFVCWGGYSMDPQQIARQYWLGVPFHKAVGLKRVRDVAMQEDNIHRLTVTYADGPRVWVNRSPEPWTVGQRVLPRYGYLVEGEGFSQRLAMEEGAPMEVVEAPDVLYVDFRGHERRYRGVQAAGAVLVRRIGQSLEIIPLGGNDEWVRVNLAQTGLLAGARPGEAHVRMTGETRMPLEVAGDEVSMPVPRVDLPQRRPADAFRRPLQKAVIALGA